MKWINREIRKGESDEEWRWDWIERHKKGMEIYYRFDKYDPTKGWRLIPNLLEVNCFEKKVINSNSRGIRGKAEHSYGKNKKKLRILFFGDSFTFGDGVSDSETYPYFLQQMLPDVEVINLAVHGYGHDQMLIYLKEESVKYQPDIVILGFLSMDSDRNMLGFRDYAKPRFKLENNRLKLCNVPVPSPGTTFKQEPWRSRFVDLLSLLQRRISRWDGAYDKEMQAVTNAILKEIITTVRGIGAVPVFAYLDNVRQKESNPIMTKEENVFLGKCENLSVKCVFLRQGVYSARLKGIKIKEQGHFGPETNQLVALGIKEYLANNGLLDRK